MTTIAELGIRVDSGDAVQAATDLEKMTKAGERAEQSAVGLMNEMQALERSLSAGARSTQELAKQRESLARLTKTGAYGEAEFLKISAQLDKQQQALVKSTMDEQKALVSLLGSVDPAQAALAKLDKQVEDLGKHLDAGRISQVQYNEALKKIDGKYAEIEKTGSAFSRLGLHTKGARENVLQLGNALAEGNLRVAAHNILEIGNSAGLSATRIAGTIGPAIAAGAAIATLGYAYYEAEKEIGAFSRALFSGPNRSGQTVASLTQISTTIGAVTGNFGAARDAVISLSSGVAGTSVQVQNLASAAVAISEITGSGVEKVAGFLESAGKNATESAARISDQYGMLTYEQYEVIKALDEQGEHQRALDVLSEDLNSAAQERLKKYRESLSDIERDWNSIKKAISNAYAEIKAEVAPNEAQQVDIARRILERRQDGGFLGAVSNLFSFGDNSTPSLKRFVASSEERAQAAERETQAQTDLNNANRDLIRISRELDRQLDNVSPAAKRTEAYKSLNEQFFELMSASARSGKDSPLLEGVEFDGKKFSGGAYDTLAAGIEARIKDPKTASSPVDLSGFNDQKNALSAILAEYKNHQKELEATQKAGLISQESYASQRAAILEQQKGDVTSAYEAEIRALEEAKGRSSTSAQQRIQLDQKIADARAAMVKAQKDADSELAVLATNEEGRLKRQAAAVQAYTDQLERERQVRATAGDRAAAALGMGDRQAGLQRELDGVSDEFNRKRETLLDRRRTAPDKYSADDYKRDLAILEEAENKYRDTVVANYDKISAAQGDWRNGASSAFSTYLEQARDVAGQTRTLFSNAFGNMEDAIVNFVKTGKLSFKDFADQVVSDLIRIQVRQAAAGFLGSALGFLGGGSQALGQGTMTGFSESIPPGTFSSGGYTGDGGKYQPMGVVHGGEFVLRKEVVAQPGMRHYLDRLNQNGYADGGFVTPLKPPIASSGAMQSSSAPDAPKIEQHFHFQGNPDQSMVQQLRQAADDGANRGAKAAYDLVLRDLKQNGPIRQLIARNR
ncbi:phage tail tape measure protein [Pseudomonas putida]|uniref:phage tail tape measure protein n=1 Tax=Pseudomonas putida TaxID=303 RepID=UPI00125FDCE1|nr:phage tail tape measure protein [Pseudomonas putida]KAB5626294.1 phage tail tape measure protein [Pseudomonas putida]